MLRSPDRLVWAALGGLACLIPVFASKYLPTVDLPQHAAQLALWVHRGDPLFFPPGLYRFNWFTPYLGAYVLARSFAFVVGVPVALKLTVSVALLALPASALALTRVTEGEAAWALAASPLAFGVSFYSGFLNFMVAIPVAVLLVAATLWFARAPSASRGALVGVLSLLLASCHAVAYGIGLLVSLVGLWAEAGGLRATLRRSVPLLAPVPLVAVWGALTWLGESQVRTSLRWSGLPSRLFRTPAVLVGSSRAAVGVAVFAGLAAALALLGVRLRWTRATAACAIAAAALYLLVPDGAFHTVLLPERFAVLVVILILPALRLPARPWPRRMVLALLLALTLGWSGHLATRFREFDREMAGFDDLLERMDPGKIVRVVPIDAGSRAVPGYPMFWNVGAWYQVEKGGLLGFSFSQMFPELVRYRSTPPWSEPLWAKRGRLDWTAADGAFDYFVFRSQAGDPGDLFPAGPERPTLLARSGAWWLYGRSGIGTNRSR